MRDADPNQKRIFYISGLNSLLDGHYFDEILRRISLIKMESIISSRIRLKDLGCGE